MAHQCGMCSYFAETQREITIHILKRHKNSPNFKVQCTYPGCEYRGQSWGGYKSHYSRTHRRELNDCLYNPVDNPLHDLERAGFPCTEQSMDMNLALFSLKLLTKHKLPATSVNDVMDNIANYVTMAEELKIANPTLNMQTAFQHFKTQKLRISFYKRHCGLILPKDILVGRRFARRNGNLTELPSCGYIVPFLDSVKKYLQDPVILKEVLEGHESPDNIMRDFCDGQYIKNLPLAMNAPCLHFLINTDSVEITNPIGAHVKKHKIDVFYWTLLNVRPELRSKWKNIQLLGLCKTFYLKKYGLSKFLAPFISDLQLLQNGVDINVNGVSYNFHGVLIAAVADTPAAGFLGNLKQSCGLAKKGCRTCNITNDQMSNVIRFDDLEERCPVLHKERCQDLAEMPQRLRPFWSKQWGINGYSPLLDLDYINLSRILIHDPMHVLLEGLLPYGTALLLKRALREKIFTVDWLNDKLGQFPYSYLDRDNKPEEIQRKHIIDDNNIKQTAASQLTLAYILPFILSDKFSELDLQYKNYMHLVAIVVVCCSPYATIDTAGQLQELVEGYLYEFKRIYPDVQLRPKHHFMLHLPMQIIRFGPLRNQWLTRFESKNNSFKNFKIHNFINLPYSLARWHQFYSCYQQMTASEDFADSSESLLVATGSSIRFSVSYPHLLTEYRQKIDSTGDEQCYETPEIVISGLKYKPEACVLWACDPPEFLVVNRILVHRSKYFAIVKQASSEYYDWRKNSYVVTIGHEDRIVLFKELRNKWPIPMYDIDGLKYVTNRYSHLTPGFF